MMQEALSFGPWLKQQRRFLDLTQEELAQRAACSLSTLRKIEAGDLLPSKELARLLAVALAVPAAEQEAFIAFARDERRTALTPAFVALPPALPVSQAPSTPTPARRHLLPTQLTPLIGRATEIAELQQRLANPTCTLLTIVGPGGIGKTRLALAVAQQILDFGSFQDKLWIFDSATKLPENPKSKIQNLKFSDGVYFVPFAGVTAPEFMVSTLANAIGFSFANTGEPKAQLLNYLSAKAMLLVLDNLEHLLDGTDLLVEILQAAPDVKLLTTSRERLAVTGEWVFELPALPTPPQSKEAVVAVASYGSVALFVEQAQRTQHDFALSAENGAAVAQICRLVGGMPLGVELAASWVHTLACTEIAREIEQSLDFLAVSHRNLPERQRSVRATFDHSWRLLSAAEQQVLRRLSVFRGGFQREAAVQVAGATLPLLAGLVSKSLVRRTAEGRYDLHELVRQYAAGHLSDDPQAETQTRHAHAGHFLGGLDDHTGLFNHQYTETRKSLLREHENLRVAWFWAAASGRHDLLQRATSTLFYFYEACFLLHDGDMIFTQGRHLLAAHPPTESATNRLQQLILADFQAKQGWFQFRTGRLAEARPLLAQAVALLRQQAAEKQLADALGSIGLLEWMSGAFAKGEQYAQESLALHRRLGSAWRVGFSLISLGHAAYIQGHYTEAFTYLDEALPILRRVGDPNAIAMCITLLSMTTQALGRLTETEELLQEALALAAQVDDQWMLVFTQQHIGMFAYAMHDLEKAKHFLESALLVLHERNDTWRYVITLNSLGWLYIEADHGSAAEAKFEEALQIAVKAQFIPNTLNALVGLATVQVKVAPNVRYATLAHYALVHPNSDQETRQHAERLRLLLATKLTPAQIEAARTQAQTTTLESLVAAMSQS